ncbi:MAG TPA: TIGR02281 family clan AA aspartic protease [Casimicrobiaceae bacterium]|nr:TIGR02281 family clan AA aspartic protease [Casimicrobiaceae bacterium]
MKRQLASALFSAGLLFAAGASATEVTVSGLFPNKAVVQVDGGALQTLTVGQKSREGVTLLSVDRESATFDVDGERRTMGLGRARMAAVAPVAESVVLAPDVAGHFTADARVNGTPVRFVVDTGATLISLPEAEARRLSLDYRKGQKALMGTANGTVGGYMVRLDTVSIGNLTVHGVDAVVIEGKGLGTPLLGMSFLNRLNMKREGDLLTLTRRY